MPRDAADKKKMSEIFACLEDYCFCGHTHTPGIFTQGGFTHPSDMFDLYMLGSDEKVLVKSLLRSSILFQNLDCKDEEALLKAIAV